MEGGGVTKKRFISLSTGTHTCKILKYINSHKSKGSPSAGTVILVTQSVVYIQIRELV